MPTLTVNHNRGLCGKPNVPSETPESEVRANPAHCLCCGSQMEIRPCTSSGMQELGMYWLICPACPPESDDSLMDGSDAAA